MMPISRIAFVIHETAVPFTEIGRHTINTPMNENAELCLLVPLCNRIFGKTLPVCLVFSVFNYLIDFSR